MKTLLATLVLLLWAGYLKTQQPVLWCDSQWAGIALRKGGYRSWTATFCDGHIPRNGKLVPVIIHSNTWSYGHYWFPRFQYKNINVLLPWITNITINSFTTKAP